MTTLQYGPPISLALAKQVVAAAESEAMRNGWAMVIAVADSTGHLVVLHRMDHAQFGSIVLAQRKALTAIDFKRSSKLFEDAVAAGGLGLRMLAMPELSPLEGGVPLVTEGRIVGAIGVSGAQSAEDGQVAAAGARVVNPVESFAMAHFPTVLRNLPAFEGPFDAYKLAAENCDVLFASYPSGTVIPPHDHDTDNVGIITQGELILEVDGKETRYAVGEWYQISAGVRHAARFEVDTSEIEFWFRRNEADSG